MSKRFVVLFVWVGLTACKSRDRQTESSSIKTGQDRPSLQTLIRSLPREERTLTNLLGELPLEISRNWLVVSKSRSAQHGHRVFLFSDDAQVALTFNLDPKLNGYEALEVRQYDRENRKNIFAEIIFEKEYKAFAARELRRYQGLRRKGLVDDEVIRNFEDGVNRLKRHLEPEGFFIGDGAEHSVCNQCHTGGTSRFDTRRLLPVAGFEGSILEEDFERIPYVKSIINWHGGDSVSAQREKMHRIAEQLETINAESIAYRMIKLLPLKQVAGVKHILKDCNYEELFDASSWQFRIETYSQRLHGDFSFKAAKEVPEFHRANVLKMLRLMGDLIDEELTEVAHNIKKFNLPVPPAYERSQMAKLRFYLDPVIMRTPEFKENPKDSLVLPYWSMTAHFQSYWFNNTGFKPYREQLDLWASRRLQANGIDNFTCASLAKVN